MAKLLTPLLSNPKNIKQTFALLRQLMTPQTVIIRKEGNAIDRQLAKLSKNPSGGFSLQYDDPLNNNWAKDSLDQIILEGTHSLQVERVFFKNIHNTSIEGDIEQFSTLGWDESYTGYHRLVFALKKSLDFTFSITQIGFQTTRSRSIQCIRVTFQKMTLDLYVYKDEGSQFFLVLDSSDPITFSIFSGYCFSALVSLGYITGTFVQEEGVYFFYSTPELDKPLAFGLKRYRKSTSSIFIPLYSNAGGYIFVHAEVKKINPTLRPLTLAEFSRLCQWTHDSFEFSAILLLIIEAAGTSLAIMPAAYSVALESLTDLLLSEKEDAQAPIKDKKVARDIVAHLISELDKYAAQLDKSSLDVLKTRISNINQLTNKSKLTKPFELLHFTLSQEDLAAIEHRNDFLHGRITHLLDKKRKKKEITHIASSQEIYYTALRLYTLLAVLILKSIGYDNKIVNHPKIQRHNYSNAEMLEQLEREDHFRQL